jgi:hypothetical protein
MVALDTLDITCSHLACKPRILPQCFKHSAKSRNKGYIQSWTQQDIVPRCRCLSANEIVVLPCCLSISSCRQGNRSRWRCCFAFIAALLVQANASRAVGQPQGRDTQSEDRHCLVTLLVE